MIYETAVRKGLASILNRDQYSINSNFTVRNSYLKYRFLVIFYIHVKSGTNIFQMNPEALVSSSDEAAQAYEHTDDELKTTDGLEVLGKCTFLCHGSQLTPQTA